MNLQEIEEIKTSVEVDESICSKKYRTCLTHYKTDNPLRIYQFLNSLVV